MKKSVWAIVMVMVCALMLAGCGGSGGSITSKGYGDLFHDQAAINKAVAEIKTKGGGAPLMVFQNMHFGPDFINFSRQYPKNKENVDNFVWTPNTGWQGLKIVKLHGNGKLADNLFNIDDVNWSALPVFIAETEKMAKEKCIDKASLGGSIMIDLNVRKQQLTFSATVKGERKDAYVTGDVQTGQVTNFRIK
ncbi:MAG: hypothetical protein LUC29_08130 [Acidaminococcaceae bacterium]|nr:hypothetical protein [Acidaminococcaceae bacterium]